MARRGFKEVGVRYPVLGNLSHQKTCLPAIRPEIVDDADVALTLMTADRMCVGLHGAICDCTNGCTTDPLCFPQLFSLLCSQLLATVEQNCPKNCNCDVAWCCCWPAIGAAGLFAAVMSDTDRAWLI